MLYIVELAEYTEKHSQISKTRCALHKVQPHMSRLCMHSFKYIVSSNSKIKELGGLDVSWLEKDDMATTDMVRQLHCLILHRP